MPDDATLLQGFVTERRESEFAQLVERHIGMVFATALRRVGGDTHLAEDVAQSVFIDLARKAPALMHHRVLAGWLHTSTVYAAAKAVRSEQRRRRREEHAHAMHETHHESSSDADWARVRPVLDDALQALSTRDRDAILLRFSTRRVSPPSAPPCTSLKTALACGSTARSTGCAPNWPGVGSRRRLPPSAPRSRRTPPPPRPLHSPPRSPPLPSPGSRVPAPPSPSSIFSP